MADKNTQRNTISKCVETVLKDWETYYLVELKVLQGNAIKVFVDADNGASIDILARMNKMLRKQIEESGLFAEGDFSLELSSPGIDEPLKLLRQYKKNIGREVDILLKDGRKVKGFLKEVTDTSIVLEYKIKNIKGKKAKAGTPVKEPEQFSLDQISKTKICVGF